MITELEYLIHRGRITAYNQAQNELFPGICSFTPEMIQRIIEVAGCGRSPTNEERSKVEVYEWNKNKPNKYFLYINRTKNLATTWMGDPLGKVVFGNEYRANFGGKRIPITVYGTNGCNYHGTYYSSSGDYARVTMMKSSRDKVVV